MPPKKNLPKDFAELCRCNNLTNEKSSLKTTFPVSGCFFTRRFTPRLPL